MIQNSVRFLLALLLAGGMMGLAGCASTSNNKDDSQSQADLDEAIEEFEDEVAEDDGEELMPEEM